MDEVEVITSNYNKYCKFCNECEEDITVEILQCVICKKYAHSKCLQRGGVPGCLAGDIFYSYTCSDCSSNATEEFVRDRMTWLQAIVLVLYHLKTRKKALARKGYFHWKIHITAFIDHNWDTLFRSDMKRKKQWIGTISGTLSHYSPAFFISGTAVLNEQGWWALTYPKLPPIIILEINEELMAEKQKCKELKKAFDSMEKLKEILQSKPYATEAMLKSNDCLMENTTDNSEGVYDIFEGHLEPIKQSVANRRKMKKGSNLYKGNLLPTVDNILLQSKRKHSEDAICDIPSSNIFKKLNIGPFPSGISTDDSKTSVKEIQGHQEKTKYLDRFCHYTTTLSNINQTQPLLLLAGSIRNEFILSPYSSSCLSPFIWRSVSLNPQWLQLMDELKCKVNRKSDVKWKLEPRASIDFTYVQPNHIPVLNSLCQQFFWSGINLSDTLQYPEYTCVVLYKKIVVGFVCVVPNVEIDEMYLSFIFTRPVWRNCGIARFMLYHIIQVTGGKNITLHISTTNPALLLFQKFGFKIQHTVKDFYEKYNLNNTTDSKDAFFCKLNSEY